MRFTQNTKRIFILVPIVFLSINTFFICFILPMVSPHGYIHNLFGIPVSLSSCGPSSEKYYLTISVIVKDRADYMTEWLEFHFMVGVQHIYIYDNESTDNLKNVLNPYIKNGLVTLIAFPKQRVTMLDGSQEIMTQKLYLASSIATHACETRWMAMIDSDEFILASAGRNNNNNNVNNDSLIDILKRFEDFTSVVMPWSYFTSNGWVTRPNKLVIEAYTRRWKNPKHTWKHIVQPKRIKSVYSVHNFRSIPGYYSVNEQMQPFSNWPAILNGPLTQYLYDEESWYSSKVIKLHHYKTQSAEDWEDRLKLGHVSGRDNGLTDEEIAKHWEEYFDLQNVESETDTTMVRYVEPLLVKMRERFQNEAYLPRELNTERAHK